MRTVFFYIAMITTGATWAQDTAMYRTYGGHFYDVGKEVIEAPDGGYYILGTTASVLNSTSDFYFLKINEDLDFQWSKHIGGGDVDQGHCMIAAGDDYLLGGYTKDQQSLYDFSLYKVNSNGEELWSETYGTDEWDFGKKMSADEDGNIYFLGETYAGTGGVDLRLYKIDPDGNEIWAQNYGGTEDEQAGDIGVLPNGNIAIYASTKSFSSDSHQEAWLFVIDPDGTMLWEDLSGDFERLALGIDITDEAIVMVGGNAVEEAGPLCQYIHKIDFDGNEVWERLEIFAGVIYYTDVQLGSHYYAVTGYSELFGNGDSDALINGRSPNGYWIGGDIGGGNYTDSFDEVLIDSQSRTVALGWSTGYSLNQVEDIFLVRFPNDTINQIYIWEEEHYTDIDIGIEESEIESSVYPVPFSDVLTISTETTFFDRVIFHNTAGQLVLDSHNSPARRVQIEPNLPAGVYSYSIYSKDKLISRGRALAQ